MSASDAEPVRSASGDLGASSDDDAGATAVATCRPGIYGGMLACTFMPDPTMFGTQVGTVEVSGPISLTLVQSADANRLEISNGEINAVAQSFFGLHAKLSGELDCTRLKLMAVAQDGMWALGDPTMPIVPGGTFGAEITGVFDAQAQQLAGQWSLTSGSAPGTCMGTWSATPSP
jgi:hypothetical protein